MAVIRNTFTGELSSLTAETHNIIGLTGETSVKPVAINREATEHFFNSLYQTLIDAGYSDTVKDETEFSITVLGVKFFVVAQIANNRYVSPMIYVYGDVNGYGGSVGGLNYSINNSNTSPYTQMEYNITIRGDANNISIRYGSYAYPTTEDFLLIRILKGKNLISLSDIYMISTRMASNNGIYYRMYEGSNLYNNVLSTGATTNPLIAPLTLAGLNTNSKFVCVPQLAYYNTCLIYSMIQGNTKIFTNGKYYKIGNEIYHNEDGYLYKVE